MTENCTDCEEWTLNDAEYYLKYCISNIRIYGYIGAFCSGLPILLAILGAFSDFVNGEGFRFGGVSQKFLMLACASLLALSIAHLTERGYRSRKNYRSCPEHRTELTDGMIDKGAAIIVGLAALTALGLFAPGASSY